MLANGRYYWRVEINLVSSGKFPETFFGRCENSFNVLLVVCCRDHDSLHTVGMEVNPSLQHQITKCLESLRVYIEGLSITRYLAFFGEEYLEHRSETLNDPLVVVSFH